MEIDFRYLTNASISFDDASTLKEGEHFDAFCQIFCGMLRDIGFLADEIELCVSRPIDFSLYVMDKKEKNHYIIDSELFSKNLRSFAKDLYMSDSFEFRLIAGEYTFTLSADPIYFGIKRQS
ncbi:hypothetical protein [Microbulbifer sp. SAOS-129_SWC]|uniref:hypothetical protein n=1 Tax=Microbulbifer sp. SAOS-129_SWC TaxID=3145235 RepID=UPI003216B809